MSFCFHNIVVCTDIKMMYRQILIRTEDEDCIHQYIFQSKSNSAPQEYKLNTVTYGLTSSAFLAQRTLIQLLVKDEGKSYPLTSQAITKSTNVDVTSGANSAMEAQELIRQLILLFKAGGFELRKWSSNYAELH